MIIQIFTVFDEKAGCSHPPFYMNSVPEGRRTFGDCVNSKDHPYSKHPSDYTLFHIGEYDDNSMSIKPMDRPVPLGTGVEYKARQEPELFAEHPGVDFSKSSNNEDKTEQPQ